MFYCSPLCSLLHLLPPRDFRFPDFGPVVQREREREKKAQFVSCLPITKEQTHIKHTQGAAAVIAVSAVLLWVAGDDNISLGFIYIIFFKITSSLNHGQSEAREYS